MYRLDPDQIASIDRFWNQLDRACRRIHRLPRERRLRAASRLLAVCREHRNRLRRQRDCPECSPAQRELIEVYLRLYEGAIESIRESASPQPPTP